MWPNAIPWANGLLGRAHQNVAVVALANKFVRIAWAVLRRGQRFDHQLVPLCRALVSPGVA
jgi:hypothetical protein